MNSNKKKSSDFFKEISGCPLARAGAGSRPFISSNPILIASVNQSLIPEGEM
jgi:hypothetical protein